LIQIVLPFDKQGDNSARMANRFPWAGPVSKAGRFILDFPARWMLPRPCGSLSLRGIVARAISVFLLCHSAPPLPAQELTNSPASEYLRGQDLVESGQTAQGLGWLRQAGTNGLLQAQVTLANQLWLAPAGRPEALHWALLAGQQGEPLMRQRLIGDLREGDPGEYFQAAWPWLQGLAAPDAPDMQYRSGIWAFNGWGTAKNYGLAFTNLLGAHQSEPLRRQAPQGSFLMGYLAENGFGIPQDYTAAAGYYWDAAEHGWPEALYRLGLLLEHAQGVRADSAAARVLYLSAAEHGVPAAAYRMGTLTQDAGAPSLPEAFNWYLQAATNGLSVAQDRVGMAYQQDWLRRGADPVTALAWFTVAAQGGNRAARIRMEDLERTLMPAQKAEVAARINQIQSSIHKEALAPKVGENLLPDSLAQRHLQLFQAISGPASNRPRRLADVGLAAPGQPAENPKERRNDLAAGLLQIYLTDLQDRVRTLVNERLTEYGKNHPLEMQNLPGEMEIILSYRLLSDGRIEEAEVLDSNLGDVFNGLFISALRDSSPTPRWTPRLRAELSEDYQDLLLAFGRRSSLRISQ